jgi:hypothetical protein
MRIRRILRHRRLRVSRDISLYRHGPIVLRMHAWRVEVMRIMLWHAHIWPPLHLIEIIVHLYSFVPSVLIVILSLATRFRLFRLVTRFLDVLEDVLKPLDILQRYFNRRRVYYFVFVFAFLLLIRIVKDLFEDRAVLFKVRLSQMAIIQLESSPGIEVGLQRPLFLILEHHAPEF